MYSALPRPLPDALRVLSELALDMRWSWNHAFDALWSRIDDGLWAHTRNPWAVLQNASQDRLEALANDVDFMHALEDAVSQRERYRADAGLCARQSPDRSTGRIAYFSMEFGLSEVVPLYAGGLGILAGDYLKTASDLDVAAVGVGLLYQEGYFRQVVDAGGRQHALYPYNDPSSLPIQPVLDDAGGWLEVRMELPGRALFLRVWQAVVGRTRLYLLDSNDVRNGAADRGITSKLYGGGSEARLLQEVVLGIGGWNMLEAIGITPEVCHLNEGHAALAVLERARRFMHDNDTTFHEAWWATRAGNVFTTHTPVAAGFDAFPPSLILKYSRDYQADFDLPFRDLMALGRSDPGNDDEPFNMTYLALRGCAQTNAVSRLHGEVSRRLFAGIYPRWPLHEVPVRHVTNGVHVPSWDSIWADAAWTQYCGKRRWLDDPQTLSARIAGMDDAALWALAARQRRDLVDYARKRMAWQLGQRGESGPIIAEARRLLDADVLTLGFARRFAEYKRPNLLLRDPERLLRLLTDTERPVQLLVAGKAHPDDESGKLLVQAWLEFCRRPEVRRHVVFLEDYDMALARQLVQGVDVWINTPRRPWEACGTSGMKVLVNGGLNLSKLDGWWAEAYQPDYGWAIDGEDSNDEEDAETLYRLLEQEVVPCFYSRDENGISRAWVQRMRASMAQLAPQFSSNRMMLEYLDTFYAPAITAYRQRRTQGAALARDLQAWEHTLAEHWHEVHFGMSETRKDGQSRYLEVTFYPGDIPLDYLRVELYVPADAHHEATCMPMQWLGPVPEADRGHLFTAAIPDGREAADCTPRARAWHDQAFLPAESSWIAWQR